MTSRRNFLGQLTKGVGGILLPTFFKTKEGRQFLDAVKTNRDVTTDETFWQLIKQAYTVSPTLLNLNNGGVSPQARVVQEAVEHYNKLSNEAPSYYMWRILSKGKETIRTQLAQLAGCTAEEIAINRNASEALETVVFGLNLQEGDEVVLSKYDYPNMIHAWKQREQRDGIILKWVDLDLPSTDNRALTKAFTDVFSERTKLVQITHMLNWSGQILPVQKIARAAKKQKIEVLVDGAQTFAQLDFSIPDLACDYFGTSLHKWLGTPFGTGMLYVKKEKIAGLYPLFAAPELVNADVRKFEHLGTRSFPIEQGIGQAIHFHELIGVKRKEKRLRYLNNYWIKQVKSLPNIKIQTPLNATFFCGLVLVDFANKKHKELYDFLFKKKNIHATVTNLGVLKGVRISPNVYTTTKDLDQLVMAIKEFANL